MGLCFYHRHKKLKICKPQINGNKVQGDFFAGFRAPIFHHLPELILDPRRGTCKFDEVNQGPCMLEGVCGLVEGFVVERFAGPANSAQHFRSSRGTHCGWLKTKNFVFGVIDVLPCMAIPCPGRTQERGQQYTNENEFIKYIFHNSPSSKMKGSLEPLDEAFLAGEFYLPHIWHRDVP